nr:MFS transporter [Amycolatopsis suaedae]
MNKRRDEQNQLAAALTKGPAEVLDFLLPLWVGSQLGASAAEVGALTAVETAVSFVVRPVAGALADRLDRARLAAFGAVLYGLSFAGYAVTPSIGPAFGAAVLGGAGGALFWVALRARVGEGLGGDDKAFAKLFAAEGGGTAIAFVAAMSLVSKIDYRGVFWLGAAACVVAAGVLLAPSPGVRSRGSAGPKFSQLGKRMRPMLALVVVTAMAEAGVALLLLMHLQRGHGLQLGQIAAVFLPGFLVYSFLPDYLHGVVRRLGRTRVLSIAMVCSAVFAASLSFAPNPYVIAGMWILSAAAFAATIPVEQAIIAEAAGTSLGRAMGIYESASLLGATIGTFVAGQLYGTGGGWQAACFGAAGLLLVTALVVRPAVRKVAVAEFPAAVEPVPEPEPVRERPGRKQDVGHWAVHVGLFAAGQVALYVAGHSWPVLALAGELTGNQLWNSSGHWLTDVSRIWCFVFVIDTVWTWGAWLFRRR